MVDKKAHWEGVYQHTSPTEVSWFQKEPVLSLELIHNTRIDYDASIIDVGGGSSVLVDSLCKEGYQNIAVLDISQTALACAKARLGDYAQQIEWYEKDITQFKAPHHFALWHDRAVFHFLTDRADRECYVKVLKDSLVSGGHLIIAAFAPGGPTRCSGLDIVQYDANKLLAELGKGFVLVEERAEVHVTPVNKGQKFNYFRFVRNDVTV